ncbi:MAG: thioredoxin [Alphaproteobacteria bacterium]|nr:thioredoxin [Alphaproteobacteria bacterium]
MIGGGPKPGGANAGQPKGAAQQDGLVGGAAAPAAGDLIKNSNTRGFMADVIDASHDVPVIVDFWAPWCGPCKQLGPLLEKAVREARGAVRMVKINIDESPEIAQQMRIQSIPVVYAFVQGRPVDGFVGAVPESQIKTFIKRLAQTAGAQVPESPVEQAMEEAKALMEAGDMGNAGGILAQVVQHDPGNAVARARLARCHLAAGDQKAARKMLDSIAADKLKDPAVASEVGTVKAALDLAESAGAAGPLQDLKQKVAADANDHQARLDLATALYAAGDGDAAIDALLESIRRNRSWNDEAARKQLLKLFEAFGPTDPRTIQGRRKLSSVLFS